ncbi:barstar family protein [Streptomyces sp. NPDC004539]|uniref:barstar family protein n=1 Tax=Streptomyces sp. NPDC004539 TaxID=3154280 RepID=UPI0033A75BF4
MTGTPTWIRPLAEAPATAREVRGSLSRTRQDLFTEWAAGLGFPGHFGRNWDAFTDCLRDVGPLAVVVREAGDLLADAPPGELGVLLDVLGENGLVTLHPDDTPERLERFTERLSGAS